MLNQNVEPRSVAIVLGCGDVGSAIAVALHRAGRSVVLADAADPAWHRRGMAFTNAWYFGNAELDGEGACFCASLKSIPSVLAHNMIAATTWSWPGVAGVLDPVVLVDTRQRRRRGAESLVSRMAITMGVGADFVEGVDVDVAIDPIGELLRGRPALRAFRTQEEPRETGGAAAAEFRVEATLPGRFMTERRIGDAVRAGQIVGGLGNQAIAAPANGVLLGLAARGARIEPGDPLLEVDPAGVPHRCFGIRRGATPGCRAGAGGARARGLCPPRPAIGPRGRGYPPGSPLIALMIPDASDACRRAFVSATLSSRCHMVSPQWRGHFAHEERSQCAIF